MKIRRINIPIYDYTLLLIEVESKNDSLSDMKKAMLGMKIERPEIIKVEDEIKKGFHNGGYTYRNFDLRQFIIVLLPFTNPGTRLNIIGLEKRHVEDRIAEHTGVADLEALAYLAGYLTEKIFV